MPTCRFAGLFLVILGSSFATETLAVPATLGLRDAVLTTLKQNAALRVEHENVAIKEGLSQQAAAPFDLDVQTAASVDHTRTPAVDPLGRNVVVNGDSSTVSVGANQLFRNGILVSPQVSVATGSGDTLVAAGRSNLSLQIAIPLLRGLGRDSTGAAEAAARGDVAVAALLYRHALSVQAFATVAAYWDARAATESLQVRRDVENRATRLLDSMRGLVEGRLYPPVYQIQAEANLREKTTVRRDAELTEISARLTLGQALGLTPGQMSRVPVPAEDFPAADGDFSSFAAAAAGEAALHFALGARADYLAVRASTVPLGILVRQAQSDLKPRLDLNLAAGYRGYSPSTDLLRPVTDRLTGGNVTAGLAFDWPVRNSLQRGLLAERRAAERQAQAQAEQLASGLAAEVLSALAEVRLRAETARSAAAAVDTAQRALDGQQESLRNGESSVLDVINLENLSNAARLSLIQARAGYAVAVARLRYSLGAIFTEEDNHHDFALLDLTTPPSL